MTDEGHRSIVYQQLTAPSTWIAMGIVLVGQIAPVVLYPEQPAVSTAAMIGVIAGVAAMGIADCSAVSREIEK